MMTNSNTTFSLPKRDFLHSKLDEIIRLWHRGSGQGTFFFSVSDGNTNFQSGIQLDFDQVSDEPPHHPSHHPRHPHSHHQGGARRRGPARRARDRVRAAKYQAAQAATAGLVQTRVPSNFPGEGKILGTAAKPVLPLPLPNGSFFPPPVTSTVCSTLTTQSVTSTVCSTLTTQSVSPSTLVNTPIVSAQAASFPLRSSTTSVTAPVTPRDEILSESEEEVDEIFHSCGHCHTSFDSRSPPTYCPLCQKCYHIPCGTGHQCLSFFK